MAKRSKKTSTKKAPTKSEVFGQIAEKTELSRRQISEVFEELQGVIKRSLGNRGPGIFTVPGLCKMTVKSKPATKRRRGRNPFTGEEIWIKAKPASKTVRIRALKNLKEMV